MIPGNEDVIEIYTLWHRLKKRFNLIKPQPHSFKLSDTVIPTTNVDFVMSTLINSRTSVTFLEVGLEYVATVPTGKRWLMYSIGGEVTYTGLFDQIMVANPTGDPIPINEFTATGLHLFYLPHPLPLSEGDRIGFNITKQDEALDVMKTYLVYEEMDVEE